jgi:DNA-binding MarR family transcriptional regulator
MTGTAQERDRLLAAGADAYRRYISAEVLHGYATAEAVGLNATDFFCLNLLDLAGPLPAGQLAQRTGLTTGAITRVIDRLEQGRFVRRTRATDRRQVIVELSRDREPDINAVVEPARHRMLEVFQSFSADEVRVLFDYFARAAPALLAAVEELQARPTPPPSAGASRSPDKGG